MSATRSIVVLALAIALAAMAGGANAGPLPSPTFMGYVETWSEVESTHPADTRLARIPGYVNLVALAFAKPDLAYHGKASLEGTGIQAPFDGRVLRGAVALLRARHPDTRVILSVGGSVYVKWDRFAPKRVAKLVTDLGLDGVDLDIEPPSPDCRAEGGRRHCASDELMIHAITAMRAAMPRPATLILTGWSVGAYGEGAWTQARPRSRYTGVALRPLERAGDMLDGVTVMAYDSPRSFEPWQAFQAYRAVFAGLVLLGVQGLPTSTDWPRWDAGAAEAMASRVRAAGGGMMLYTLQKQPDADRLAQAICRGLGAGGCDAHLPGFGPPAYGTP